MPAPLRRLALSLAGVVLVVGGCASGGSGASGSNGDKPTVVVTTSILGDVVENVVGHDADVEVLMPAGADPHEFQLSAQQAASMQEADIIIANGLGFEAGMADAIDAARSEGVPVYEVAPDVNPIPFVAGAGADDAEAGTLDSHFFTDPVRMAHGAENIAAALGDDVPALDTPAVRDRASAYADTLRSASHEIATELGAIPAGHRKLVTNHEVFGYLADRYDFEVIGTVVPSGTTLAEPSSRELGDLADTIREAGVPAIFADTSSPTDLADALAQESGVDVQVVALFSESLGGPGSGAATYLDMIHTNADAITAALS